MAFIDCGILFIYLFSLMGLLGIIRKEQELSLVLRLDSSSPSSHLKSHVSPVMFIWLTDRQTDLECEVFLKSARLYTPNL